MPHFTLQITGDGPMVLAFVTVSEGRAKALTEAKQPMPDPIKIRALVDTGASCTCVDPKVLEGLGLTPTGTTTVVTAGGVPEERSQFDIGLVIPGSNSADSLLIERTIPVVATHLLEIQGFHALIGRDILGRCVMNYNGALRTFTIAY